jgi:adenine phosphoribosyltransferase
LALELGIPFIPIRKKGKLPGEVLEERYDLEYGSAVIEVQRGALKNGDKVLVHDDVLATGGTALAAAHLVHKSGAVVEGFNFIIMLGLLGGDEKLNALNCNIYNLAVS